MIRLLCLAIGYLFGMFQTAYIYGRTKGIDIREKGSGNAGTTNSMRVFGTKVGILVLICDIAKTMIAIALVKAFVVPYAPDMKFVCVMYAACGAILGHNFPFYLQFRGGKGIAATAGLILSMPWPFIVVGVAVFFGIFFTTHYVSLGSLLVYVTFMITLVVCGQTGFLGATNSGHLIEIYCIGLFLAVMAFWKHRSNIQRLLAGTEKKTYLSKKKKEA